MWVDVGERAILIGASVSIGVYMCIYIISAFVFCFAVADLSLAHSNGAHCCASPSGWALRWHT